MKNQRCLFVSASNAAMSLVMALVLSGCGGGGSTPPPTPPPQLQSITVTPASPSIALGLTQQLLATGRFSDGNTRDLTGVVSWNSSTPAIAQVNGSGLVTSLAQGTATISATTAQTTGSTSVTVGPPVLASITVAAPTAKLFLGENQSFTATGRLTDNSTRDLTQTATWSSSSNLLVLMDNGARKGMAYPRGRGQGTVIATSGGIAGSLQVTVGSHVARYGYVSNNTDETISYFVIDPQTGKTRTVGYTPTGGAQLSPFGIAIDPQQKFLYAVSNFLPGISAFTIDSGSGRLTPMPGSPFAANNFFQRIAKIHPSGKYLYTSDQGGGIISGYAIDPVSGALSPLPGSPFAGQTQVSGLDIEPFGRFLYTANQNNTISEYSINQTTGAITPLPGTPIAAASFPVSVAVDPTGRFAYIANFGANSVSAFTIDAVSGQLTEIAGSPFPTGPSPEHVSVHPSGRFVYVAHDTGVRAYASDPTTGALTTVANIAAGPDATTVAPDPSGDFLYVASVLSQTMHVFAVNSTTGALTVVEHSAARHAPIFVALTKGDAAVSTRPKFVYSANFTSGDIAGFSVDAATGALTGMPGSPFSLGGSAISVAATPDGKFVFAADFSGNRIVSFAADPTTGALTQISGALLTTTNPPSDLWSDPSGLFLYAVHQSAVDNLSLLSVDTSTGTLSPLPGSPLTVGSAPVSLTMSPTGKYLVTGNTSSSDLTVLRSSGSGGLSGVAGSPFASPFFVRELAYDPTGRFLYAPITSSFMGPSSVIAAYSQDVLTGALTPIANSPFTSGANPVAAVVDPTGRFGYVANFDGESVGMFRLDGTSGGLTALTPATIAMPGGGSPIALAVDGSGKYLFVAMHGPSTTATFKIDPVSGTLTLVSSGNAGTAPFSITVVEERK